MVHLRAMLLVMTALTQFTWAAPGLSAQDGTEIPVPPIRTGLAPMPGPDRLAGQPWMPNPLIGLDGNMAVNAEQFDRQRGELKAALEYYAVGSMPPAPGNLRGEVVRQAELAGGEVRYELVRLSFGPENTQGFDVAIFRPVGDGPHPVFIHPSFHLTPGGQRLETMPRRPEQGRGMDALRLPLGIPESPPETNTGPPASAASPEESAEQYAELFERGYALAIYHYQDTGEDTIARNPDGSWAYRNTRYIAAYPSEDWGLLGAWAWGISRVVDYLEQQPYADAGKLIAIGHSRLGKAVQVAGAFEERLAMAVPAGTAGGGVGAYRFCGLQDQAETLDIMVKKYPNWFSPRLRQFSGRADRLPFDQHWFAALTAPRAFLALEGIDDRICSPWAVRESIEGAEPVYALYGAPSRLGVHYADHGHALTLGDWSVAMDFADRELRGHTVARAFDEFPAKAYPEPVGMVIDLAEAGGVGDGATTNTKVIQDALNRIAGHGGGTLIVPAGDFLTGAIELRSNTTLKLAEGAILRGTQNAEDYPLMEIRWEGRWVQGHRAMIYAKGARNIRIEGPGHIEGPTALGRLRNPRAPALIEPISCVNVELTGFSAHHVWMWTIHPTYCENVTIRDLFIRTEGGNGDGIDIDSTRNVYVDGCDIETGDDCIAMKSGRGNEGWSLARKTENVRITNCIFADTIFGGVAIGSEMSAGVRNVHIEHCTFRATHTHSIYIKSRPGRGGTIEDVTVRNITVQSARLGFLRLNLLKSGKVDPEPVQGEIGIPQARNLLFENIKIHDAGRVAEAWLIPEQKPVEGFTLRNVTGRADTGVALVNMRGVVLEEIDVEVAEGPKLETRNVSGTGLEGAVELTEDRN